tara:strand:+ start:234 stop:479 length:246 start_codon:yes stop_codon:yes gene_type:complete
MPKLIDKIEPVVLRALERSAKIKYSSSYKYMITSLEGVSKYRDLTIDQIQTILIYLPDELHPRGRTDFYYGDYLLQKKYQV